MATLIFHMATPTLIRYKGSLENMLEAEQDEQQHQSGRSRAGMMVKDFLSRNSRRRGRRGRMFSLPSRYVIY